MGTKGHGIVSMAEAVHRGVATHFNDVSPILKNLVLTGNYIQVGQHAVIRL